MHLDGLTNTTDMGNYPAAHYYYCWRMRVHLRGRDVRSERPHVCQCAIHVLVHIYLLSHSPHTNESNDDVIHFANDYYIKERIYPCGRYYA